MKESQRLNEVLQWMKTTDLAEVSYRRAGEGVSLRADSPPPAAPAFPPCSLSAVTSPEVGVFRWAAPGQAGRLEQGSAVSAGQQLCRIQVGKREATVPAPAAGRLVCVLADDGDPVEYGQPLFFIRPE